MQASQNRNNEQMLTSDGIPLKKKLSKALFRSRLRAFGLVTPLLLLISIGFVFPILVFLTRGVYNDTFEKYMVNLTPVLAEWNGISEPTEEMFEALAGIAQETEISSNLLSEEDGLLEALALSGLVDSKGAARRLLKQGGVSINRVKVSTSKIDSEQLVGGKYVLLQKGKKQRNILRFSD